MCLKEETLPASLCAAGRLGRRGLGAAQGQSALSPALSCVSAAHWHVGHVLASEEPSVNETPTPQANGMLGQLAEGGVQALPASASETSDMGVVSGTQNSVWGPEGPSHITMR